MVQSLLHIVERFSYLVLSEGVLWLNWNLKLALMVISCGLNWELVSVLTFSVDGDVWHWEAQGNGCDNTGYNCSCQMHVE